MMYETAALVTLSYAAQVLMLLGLGILLGHYFRLYHRAYLRFWSYAALYSSLSVGFATANLFLRDLQSTQGLHGTGDAWYSFSLFAQFACFYIALALLSFGVFDIMRAQAPPRARRWYIYVAAGMIASISAAFGFFYPASSWVGVVTQTLLLTISGIVLLSIASIVIIYAHRSLGPRMIAAAFMVLGLKNIVLAILSCIDSLPLSAAVWAIHGTLNLVMLSIVAIGIIIWLLESERHRTFKALQQAEYLNTHDALTGIENREELVNRLPGMIEHCRLHHRHLTVFVIGLNRFKAVNDTLGIRGGDRVLIEVSQRLQQFRPAPLTVARLSGDVFLVAFDHLKKRSLVEQLAHQIQTRIQTDLVIEGRTINLSCAIGVARYPQHAAYAESLLSKANIALSQAKNNQNASIVFYQRGMDENYSQLIGIEPELKRAFSENEFVLHLQPLYAGNSSLLNGFEALIRWQHPERGLLPPSEFLPFIEELGLSIELDDWVLQNTAQILKSWRQQGLEPLPIAVNVCARHFQNPALISKLKALFHRYQLRPGDIELEITESIAMTDIQAGLNVLEQLRELQIRVSIDDFGTGYSSLAYLRRLPVDKIKIDRSFIRELLSDSMSSENTIVRTLIELSHGLRKRVVAEGVETQEQLSLLNIMRCDQVQGYLLSPPVNLSLARDILAKHHDISREVVL